MVKILRALIATVAFFPTVSAENIHLAKGTGANVAIAQGGIDYAKDKALPFLVDFISKYPLPNPIVSGEKDSLEYTVGDVTLSNLGLGAKVQFVAPNKLSVHLDIQSLTAHARVHGRETIWPHPTVTAHATANAKSSSADVVLSLDVDSSKQLPSLGRDSCNAHIDVDISVSGLGILDGLADDIVKSFRSSLESEIGKALCDAVSDGIGVLSGVLTGFNYQQDLGPELQNAIIDFHLTSSPTVVTGPPLYIQAPLGAEFMSKNKTHAPISAPVLPTLSSAEMGSHMVTVQLSTWPVNTALSTAHQGGLLQYDVHKGDLGVVSVLLTTDYWAKLLPQMAARFNTTTDMLIRVKPADPPSVSLANKTVGIQGKVLLEFVALAPEGEVSAFTFGSPVAGHGEARLTEDLKSITASIDDIDDLDFSVTSSNFGEINQAVFVLINPLLNAVMHQSAIHRANKFLAPGYAIPVIASSIGSLSFAHPEIAFSDGYLLVGADLVFDLKPSSVGQSFVV